MSYLESVFAAFEAALVTEGEWKRVDRVHRELVVPFLREEEG
jgi:hypothetical protein